MKAKRTRKSKPGATVDPIFAVIEAHKIAFMRRMKASAAAFGAPENGPDYIEPIHGPLHAADTEARNVDEKAAFQLAIVEPTSMAGVLALIEYVEAFNKGKFVFALPWCSARTTGPPAC